MVVVLKECICIVGVESVCMCATSVSKEGTRRMGVNIRRCVR